MKPERKHRIYNKMNRICELFGIRYPIVQGGMVWCSGWRLASAVSNAGGLGLLGAGSMHPEPLVEHIRKMKDATDRPWGVNVGTLFALSAESSASEAFKRECLSLEEGGTMLCLKNIAPTRLVKNNLYYKIAEAEANGASEEELRTILGKAASKRGIFEGDIEGGELEIGQITSSVSDILPPAGT